MTRKRTTVMQVAEKAGVSRSTVSFILNGNPHMKFSAATRQRVVQAAEDLNYVPNAAAKMLASRQTKTLGLVIYNAEHLLVDAFIPRVLYGLIKTSQARGFRVLVETVEDLGEADTYRSLVRAKQIDGLVVLNPLADDRQLWELIDEGFPLVLIGEMGHPGEHAVFHDAREAAEEAVAHLIALGHERIAHVTYAPLRYGAAESRLGGYKRALERAGLTFDPRLVRYGNYDADSGREAMRSLLDVTPKPTAVFASNDTIAIGVLGALYARGLRVPEDVAVVGYDDIPNARHTVPPLTTVRTTAPEQGCKAAEMLIDLINEKPLAEAKVSLAPRLIVRESCGAALQKRVETP